MLNVFWRSAPLSGAPPASVLVVRTGHLGDTVTAIPALRQIRAWAPGADLRVLCDRPLGGQTPARSVLDLVRVVDWVESFAVRPRWRAVSEVRDVISRVRPDVGIILGQARTSRGALARQAAVLRLCGIGDVRLVNPVFAPGSHWPGEAERLCRGLNAVGIGGEPPPFAIPDFPEARERVAQRLAAVGVGGEARYLVFCGGGKAPTQRWPLERYAVVLRRLSQQARLAVVAIGSLGEIEAYRMAFDAERLDVRYLEGTELAELFELCRGATAYLGNDTGPMHVAAAVHCPVVVVMSARNAPGQWYPEVARRLVFRRDLPCQDCFLEQCVEQRHRCMTGIGVDEVVAGTLRFLAKLPRRGAGLHGMDSIEQTL